MCHIWATRGETRLFAPCIRLPKLLKYIIINIIVIIIIIIIIIALFYFIVMLIFDIYFSQLWKHVIWSKQSWVFLWNPLCQTYIFTQLFLFVSLFCLLRVFRACWEMYQIFSRFESWFFIHVFQKFSFLYFSIVNPCKFEL